MLPEHYVPPIMVTLIGLFCGLIGIVYRNLIHRIKSCESQVLMPSDIKRENMLTIVLETRNHVRHIRQHCVMCQCNVDKK
jgi:hypothetical protein